MDSRPDDPRVIGAYSRDLPGPTVLVTAGIHGNEPAGLTAARRVLAALEEHDLPIRGRVVAIKGNVQAIGAEQRYLAKDLNRCWSMHRVRALLTQPRNLDCAEDQEQREILEVIRRELAEASGPFTLLDLHSTSAGGAPFAVIGDTLRNRRLAFALPMPVLLGLDEAIDGSLVEFVTELGHRAMAIEGGQHTAAATPELHEAALWLFLQTAGCLSDAQLPEIGVVRRRMNGLHRGLPRVVEILLRHPVSPDDGFVMHDEIDNFTRVTKGQHQREAGSQSGAWPRPPAGLLTG